MVVSFFSLTAANNVENLITSSDWETLFPERAGIKAGHPQGYTYDFYSYANFIQAVEEMANVSATFSRGIGGRTNIRVTNNTTGAIISDYFISTEQWTGDPLTINYGDFCNRADDYNNRRELAAFFANITKETTGGTTDVGSGFSNSHQRWGLFFVKEVATSDCYTTGTTTDYSPLPGRCYSGRGPIQLSYFYNYGNFSDFIYGDERLVSTPEALESDPVLAFKSAIWFWMTPQCPKPSAHQAMHEIFDETAFTYSSPKMNKKGFAHTNNIINGGLECRSSSSFTFYSKVKLRSDLYQYYMGVLGFTSGEIALENSGDYTTTCYDNASSTMQAYELCAFRDVVENCTTPDLGSDQTICEDPITLDANVALKAGDAIAWYRDNILIPGETGTSIVASIAGKYRATITSETCTRSDIVVLTQSGDLVATVDNDGFFCAGVGPDEVTINVTGGGGFYNFYTVPSGGDAVNSGSSYTVDELVLPLGENQTYYIEEPGGQVITLGANELITTTKIAQYQNIATALSFNDFRAVFTAEADVTLESVDFATANLGNGTPAELIVEVYPFGGGSLVASKTFDLENTDFADWDQTLFTASLGFELSAGQYELSITPSNVAVWLTQNDFGDNLDYDLWNETGIASVDGSTSPSSRGDGVFQNALLGMYNFVFSTGGGVGSACGRLPVTVSHDCTTLLNELNPTSFEAFPNPANDFINLNISNKDLANGVVEVFNAVGQTVISQGFVNSSNTVQINATSLESGVYYVKVSSGNNSHSARVIISK